MLAEASAGVLAAPVVVEEVDDCCASSKCAVVAEEAEREGAPVQPGGADKMGFPATPRGIMRRDGAEAAEGPEVEEEVDDDDEAAAAAEAEAAAAAPLLFLAETAEAAFIFGLRRTGSYVWSLFVFVSGLERGARG